MTVRFRPATPGDAEEIGEIAAASAGKGPFGARQHMRVEPYAIFTRHPHTRGIVGYNSDSRVVSYFFYRPMTLTVTGEPTRSIFSFNEAVHPEFRRQGIGQKMLRALSDLALDLDSPLLFFDANRANTASRNLALKGGFVEAGRYSWTMTLTRRRRPRLPAGVRVRRAEPSDLFAWAAAANEFYRGHEFWQPLSAELLGTWLKPDHTGIKRSLYLAEDRNGRILAGMGSDDCNQLFTWELGNAPRLVRIAGRLLGILHAGRYIRVVRIVVPWCQSSYEGAGRALWQWLRWQLRPDANVITVAYDPRSRVKTAIPRSIYSPSREGYRYVPSGVGISGSRAIVADLL